ncbi:MAG TPA: flavin-dependent oxidoreductase [Actinocrinis sp.]|nr:flavin-dependent oxidoreductase [Actinocrinis sp.]
MRALIIGAGIGGLTTALSLHAAGIEAQVIEAAAELRPLGVGINLLPHAVRELTELGLGEQLAGLGIATAEFVHLDRFGNRIWSEPRGLAAGYRWPQYSVHRGELQAMLVRAVVERIGGEGGPIRTGTVFRSVTQDAHGIRAEVVDRATGAASTIDADVLIGADGLNSAVRKQLHPEEGPPLWNGVRMWRGAVEGAPFLSGRSLAVLGSNTRAKFVAYPISRSHELRGSALVNWVAEVRMPEGAGPVVDWNRAGRLEDVRPHFDGWRFDGVDVCALMAAGDRILEYPMVDRDPLPAWGQGRVTLLGDAAHPMYPIGSNGASQAVLDARVLAYELVRAQDPVKGLAGYEAERLEKTNKVVLAHRSIPMDRVLNLVAERAPDGFAAIADVLAPAELAELSEAFLLTTGTDAAALNSRASFTPAR